jgi:hypothetical protein
MKARRVIGSLFAVLALSAVAFTQAAPTQSLVTVNVLADGKVVAKITVPANMVINYNAAQGGPNKDGLLLSGGATITAATADKGEVITITGDTLQMPR